MALASLPSRGEVTLDLSCQVRGNFAGWNVLLQATTRRSVASTGGAPGAGRSAPAGPAMRPDRASNVAVRPASGFRHLRWVGECTLSPLSLLQCWLLLIDPPQ